MPRRSSSKQARSSGGVQIKVVNLDKAEGREITEDDRPKYVPKQGFFEFVVLSFTGKLPTEGDYVKEKDPLMVGFRYGNKNTPSWLDSKMPLQDVTAYDFLTNPVTGMRAGQKVEPHGSSSVDLTKGITSWSDLPPLYIWRQGVWLSKILKEDEFNVEDLPMSLKVKAKRELENWPSSGVPEPIYRYYVTSGEGTTGNNLYRIFELPEEQCGRDGPHHPLMWPERTRRPPDGAWGADSNAWKGESWREESAPTRFSWETSSYPKYEPTVPTPTVKTITAPKAPPIPAGVRYRCVGCGHWFAQGDLPGHALVCGKGEEADWAMMCHNDCGCRNLDEASTPKQGFPRPKKVEEKEEEAVDAGGTATDPAESPGDAGDPEVVVGD